MDSPAPTTSNSCALGLEPNLSALTAQANYCLFKERGIFFDGCLGECSLELNFLRLSQIPEIEAFVYGKLFPVLVFFVVVANLLVALVLSQKHMVSPTNVVLKYMAIADLFVGLVPLPWNFFYYTLKNSEHEEVNLELWWCYMYKYSMDAIPPVFHNIAMWLTVLLAGQRYLSIRNPLASRVICRVRNVRIATLVITVISILCGLPKSLDYHFQVYEGWAFVEPGRWTHLRTCLSGFTALVKVIGSTAFFNFYFWTRVFGFILLPSFLLIVLNVLLIQGIRRAQIRKDRLLREKRVRDAQRQIDSNSTSIMLVVIVSIFLLVNLPQAIFMALLCVYSTFEISSGLFEGIFPTTFLLVSNMLVMATYPINFGVYCFMSSSFRETFKMMFCHRKYWSNGTGASRPRTVIAQLSQGSTRFCKRTDSVINPDLVSFLINSIDEGSALAATNKETVVDTPFLANLLPVLNPSSAYFPNGSAPQRLSNSSYRQATEEVEDRQSDWIGDSFL